MSPDTRDFLATVRRAEDPNPSDESRVLAALEATIAGSPTSGAGSPFASKGVLSSAGSGLRLTGPLFGVSVGAALVVAAVSFRSAQPNGVSGPRRVLTSDAMEQSSPGPAPSTVPVASAGLAAAAVAASSAPRASNSGAIRAVAPRSASLREEIALLAAVQSALERGDGAEALERLDRHATSDRQFVAERRAARIAALCSLGRVSEAQQQAALFLRDHPRSVQRTTVERSCAGTKTNP